MRLARLAALALGGGALVGALLACVAPVALAQPQDSGIAMDAGLPAALADAGLVVAPDAPPSDAATPVPSDASVPGDEPYDAAGLLALANESIARANAIAAQSPPTHAAGAAGASPDEHGPPSPEPIVDPGVVVRTVLGLIVLLALAWIGGHPSVRRLEEWLGVSQVVTAGFAFVALGLVAAHPSVGILSHRVVRDLAPLLHLGLGWIGLLTGYQFDLRDIDRLPRGSATLVVAGAGLPFVLVFGGCALLMLALGLPWSDATFLRAAGTLAAAGAITSPSVARLLADRGLAAGPAQIIARVGVLDDIAGIGGLALLGAFFRPVGGGIAWAIPAGATWFFITLGLGATLGIVVYAILRRPAAGAESILLVLGSVSFGAGMAGYLSLSPIVVCFIAGVILANLPGDYKEPLRATLERLERPIYLLFLVVVGALWHMGDWRGWLLMPIFVVLRLLGRRIGLGIARRRGADELVREVAPGLIAAPMGALSIAIVVNVQETYQDDAIPWMLTAVIGGAIVTEILVQFSARVRSYARRSSTLSGSKGGDP